MRPPYPTPLSRIRPRRLLPAVVVLIGLAPSLAKPPPVREPIATPTAYPKTPVTVTAAGEAESDALDTSDIHEQVARLSAPLYDTRQAALQRLIDIGESAYDPLREAYHATDLLEVRLLIEEIVQTIYLNKRVFNRNAFLGVQQNIVPLTHDDDPRITEGKIGVVISKTIAGTAAEATGIRAKDVIIALDGEPLTGVGRQAINRFGESIRARPPGTPVVLTILRGPRRLELTAILRPRPARYYAGAGAIGQMLRRAQSDFRTWWDDEFRRPHPAARP